MRPWHLGQLLTSVRIPELDTAIPIATTRSQSLAIGKKGQAENGALVTRENTEFLAGSGIPQADRFVPAAAGQFLPIACESDRFDNIGMSLKLAQFAPGGRIP